MARTDYINTTDALVQQVKTWITNANATWSVAVYNGTNQEDLLGMLPGLKTGAAISYDGSTWESLPRRKATISVWLVAHNGRSDGTGGAGVSIRNMIDSAIDCIDEQLLNHAFFQVESDVPVDVGPGISAARVMFSVGDY